MWSLDPELFHFCAQLIEKGNEPKVVHLQAIFVCEIKWWMQQSLARRQFNIRRKLQMEAAESGNSAKMQCNIQTLLCSHRVQGGIHIHRFTVHCDHRNRNVSQCPCWRCTHLTFSHMLHLMAHLQRQRTQAHSTPSHGSSGSSWLVAPVDRCHWLLLHMTANKRDCEKSFVSTQCTSHNSYTCTNTWYTYNMCRRGGASQAWCYRASIVCSMRLWACSETSTFNSVSLSCESLGPQWYQCLCCLRTDREQRRGRAAARDVSKDRSQNVEGRRGGALRLTHSPTHRTAGAALKESVQKFEFDP